jgi:HAD superfamily hydrolase (TIGR01509 family)
MELNYSHDELLPPPLEQEQTMVDRKLDGSGIEALVFDMDGTLVDSEHLHYKAWKKTLGRQNVEDFPYDEFVAYVGASNEQLAEDYIVSERIPVTVDELVGQKQLVYLEMIAGIELLPGVRKTIEQFHGTLRLAVASSSHRIELDRILNTLGLSECFEQVVGGDMVHRKKPDPEIYLKTCDLLGLKPSSCVAFEDSETGVAAARDAGMLTVAIPHGLSMHHDFGDADLVVEQMDEVAVSLLQRFVS